jgi:hypothetical protein
MAKEFSQIIKPRGITDASPRPDTLLILGLRLTENTLAAADSPHHEWLSIKGGEAVPFKAVTAPVAEEDQPKAGVKAKPAATKSPGMQALVFGEAAPRFNSIRIEVNSEIVERVGAVFIQPEISAERNFTRKLVMGFARPVNEIELADLPWLIRVRQSSSRGRI